MTIAEGDPLTPRQREILKFFFEFLCQHGYQPSYSDIAEEFDFEDRNGSLNHIDAIARKGWLERSTGTARSLKILLQPDGTPFRGLSFLPAPQETPQ